MHGEPKAIRAVVGWVWRARLHLTVKEHTVHSQVEVSRVRSDWVACNTGVLRGVSLFYTADLQDGLNKCHPVHSHQLLVDGEPGTITQGSATSTPRDGRCGVTGRNTHEHSRAGSGDCSAVGDDHNPRSICISIQTWSKRIALQKYNGTVGC